MKKIIVLISLFSSGALAAEVGPAGCGLGNVVFGTQNQVLASTTNGTSGNQTFGITSGTSNCVETAKTAQIENYVDANKVALLNDAARGQGETLASLSQLMGCDSAQMGGVVKAHYGTIFSNQETKSITAKLITVVENNATTAKCGI